MYASKTDIYVNSINGDNKVNDNMYVYKLNIIQ